MDGEWTRAYASGPATVVQEQYPSSDKFALRQIGKKKPKVQTDTALQIQTRIPVVQQGTGPFGNETDPANYPSLDTHRDQQGRLCLLISSASLLVLGVGCIVTCFTGAGLFDYALARSCDRFPMYWKYRCLPVDVNSTTACKNPSNWDISCCVNSCSSNNQIEVRYKRCVKKCTERFPNYENDLAITAFQSNPPTQSWGQQDPSVVCKNQVLSSNFYGKATWYGALSPKKLDSVSDWHITLSKLCWAMGTLGFAFATLGAGLFGLFGALYTDFKLGVMIFQGVSLVFFLFFFVVSALSFALAAYWEDLWLNRLQPICRQKDATQLLYLSDCLQYVPLCRLWEEWYYFVFALYLAIGIVFLLSGLVMFFGAIYTIFYPVVKPKEVTWSTATFSPMVGPGDTAAGLPLPQQAHRLHQTLTGRPGVLPLTYTIALPHKSVEELYERRPPT